MGYSLAVPVKTEELRDKMAAFLRANTTGMSQALDVLWVVS